jgi:hypothetical protein
MRLAMTFPAQHDAIKQRRIRSAPMMKFERVPNAAPLTAIDSAAQGRLAHSRLEFAAAVSVCHLASCLARLAASRRPTVPPNPGLF